MHLHFVRASRRLAKTFFRNPDGNIAVDPYPHVTCLTSETVEIDTIRDMYHEIRQRGPKGQAMLRAASLTQPLENESRAGKTGRPEPVGWIELDVDKVQGYGSEIDGINALHEEIGFGDTTCIIQWSASAGVTVPADTLSYHAFFFIRPTDTKILNAWLKETCLSTPGLATQIRLNRTNDGLTYPLDPQVNSWGSLLYIASPVFKSGLKDPYTANERTFLLEGDSDVLSLQFRTVDMATLRTDIANKINGLRYEKGLPRRRFSTRSLRGVQVVKNADPAELTEMLPAGRFVRFNLNGGTSFAHWADLKEPKVLHSFKDPDMHWATADVLGPDMVDTLRTLYEERRAQEKEEKIDRTRPERQLEDNQDRIILGFWSLLRDTYFVGYYYRKDDRHELYNVSTRRKVAEFLTNHQLLLDPDDETPVWEVIFDPAAPVIDVKNKIINQYQPTDYLKHAPTDKRRVRVPPNIMKLLTHIMGGDSPTVEDFLNWLAVHVRMEAPVRSAWIFQGTSGTGKSALIENILRPILGDRYVHSRSFDLLFSRFNADTGQSRLTAIEEVDTDQLRNNGATYIAKMKDMITSATTRVELKGANAYDIPNYTAYILNSNMSNVWHLSQNDRRFHVAPRQDTPLKTICDTRKLFEAIDTELQAFTDYLFNRPVDVFHAQTPKLTKAKEDMIGVTENSRDNVARKFRTGDLLFFLESGAEVTYEGGSEEEKIFAGVSIRIVPTYREIMRTALTLANQNTQHYLTHAEMFVLFHATVGNAPNAKTKLGHYLAHAQIKSATTWLNNQSVRRFSTSWTIEPEHISYWKKILKA